MREQLSGAERREFTHERLADGDGEIDLWKQVPFHRGHCRAVVAGPDAEIVLAVIHPLGGWEFADEIGPAAAS